MMKKILISFIFIASFTFVAKAQLEISPYFGYYWGGHVNFFQGVFNMHDGPDYGLSVGVPTIKGNTLELQYSYSKTTAEFIPYSSSNATYEYSSAAFSTSYILIGSVQEFKISEKVSPFIGVSIGTAIYNYNYGKAANVWKIAAGINGGIKFFVSDRVGVKLQGRLLMPMYFAGVGFYAGIGSAGSSSGLSLNGGVLAVQGDVSAGLIFRLE